MEFNDLEMKLQKNFQEMIQDETHLFEVDLDKDKLWNLYLDSFPPGTNEIYRERREYDCSCCRQFIKSIGNVVRIKDNKITTIWDFKTNSTTYQLVLDALNKYVKSKVVSNVWLSKFKKVGTEVNYEQCENGDIKQYDHFYLEVPDKLVNNSYKSNEEVKSEFKAAKSVFKRSLEEITEDSVLTILELIASNTLYKGEEWKGALTKFLEYKKAYTKLKTESKKDLFAWENSVKAGIAVAKIRNHSLGTLLVDVSDGVDLDVAVRKYEKIVAPENYKRPKAIFTQKMLEEAKKTIEDLGYVGALPRRYAMLDDITINHILFSNKDSAKRIIGSDVFAEMSNDIAVNPKKFSKIEEVSISDFIHNILPITNELEILFENRHSKNMVSLITAENKDSPSMFKWDNPFSWAYAGNIADSSMKENVKNAGGNVEGVLRFSIQWNDEEYNPNDFDAHCIEPHGHEIYYGNKRDYNTSGQLDVDIINPVRNIPAVENITWIDKYKMKEGVYQFFVHNYNNRGGRSGFKAEIEFDGQIYSFEYNKELRQNERIQVAEVTFNRDTGFSIKEKLPSNVSSKEVWNLKTNQFIPVSVVCYSPNYWAVTPIGHIHYMFMLKDCINPESPNGFFNEYLKNDLEKHKRVFEALGSKMRVKDVDDQLSGIGFSSTKRNELIVKVKGKTERVMKIKF